MTPAICRPRSVDSECQASNLANRWNPEGLQIEVNLLECRVGSPESFIAKTRFYDRFRGALNERQEKVLARIFEAGPDGFVGGLSAEKYIAITKTSRATATRDLADLVGREALTKTGQLKGTRYQLNRCQ